MQSNTLRDLKELCSSVMSSIMSESLFPIHASSTSSQRSLFKGRWVVYVGL